jgi:hypothetical protein
LQFPESVLCLAGLLVPYWAVLEVWVAMARLVGGNKYKKICAASLIFFIIVLVGNIYLIENQQLIKSVIQAIIATIIFTTAFILFQNK